MLLYLLLCLEIYPINALLYPPSSVIQLVGSISVPVIDLPPIRRIAFDWGFQMNYDMPFVVSSFYNTPIWSITNGSSIRKTRSVKFGNGSVHPRDFGVIEVYEAIEGILESFEYSHTCLLLGICDLMRVPFEKPQQHIISDLLSLFLRPSLHLRYGRKKLKKCKSYLLAEIRGKMGLNCKRLYVNCTQNPLNLFSKISYNDEES